MAIKFVLDQTQYFQGSVTLTRGDSWSVTGTIANDVGGVNSPVNISGYALTGWFPGPLQASVVISNAPAGLAVLQVPASGTLSALLEANPVTIYLTALNNGFQQTIQTIDAPIIIQDPGFNFSP